MAAKSPKEYPLNTANAKPMVLTESDSDKAEYYETDHTVTSYMPHDGPDKMSEKVKVDTEGAKTKSKEDEINTLREKRGRTTATKIGRPGKPSVRLGHLERKNIKLHATEIIVIRLARGGKAT